RETPPRRDALVRRDRPQPARARGPNRRVGRAVPDPAADRARPASGGGARNVVPRSRPPAARGVSSVDGRRWSGGYARPRGVAISDNSFVTTSLASDAASLG